MVSCNSNTKSLYKPFAPLNRFLRICSSGRSLRFGLLKASRIALYPWITTILWPKMLRLNTGPYLPAIRMNTSWGSPVAKAREGKLPTRGQPQGPGGRLLTELRRMTHDNKRKTAEQRSTMRISRTSRITEVILIPSNQFDKILMEVWARYV